MFQIYFEIGKRIVEEEQNVRQYQPMVNTFFKTCLMN